MSESDQNREALMAYTAEIVASYVSQNAISTSDLPNLISAVHASMMQLNGPKAEPAPEPLTPPVSIKKSVTPDYLISLEDGKRYKSLKRHLSGRGLTPADYRTKWGLPHDYPMVAPNYAAQRSALAKSMGLGRKPAEPAPEVKAPRRRKAA